MKCPKCKSEELKKKDHESPYFCKKCSGMWLNNIDDPCLYEMITDSSNDAPALNEHDGMTGLCPENHGIMIRAKVDIDEPFYLEKCTSCGGIWFDAGEWQRVTDNNLSDQLSFLWSQSWQRNQSKAKNRSRFLATNKEKLGDDIFNDIISLSLKLATHPEKNRAIALLQHETVKKESE